MSTALPFLTPDEIVEIRHVRLQPFGRYHAQLVAGYSKDTPQLTVIGAAFLLVGLHWERAAGTAVESWRPRRR